MKMLQRPWSIILMRIVCSMLLTTVSTARTHLPLSILLHYIDRPMSFKTRQAPCLQATAFLPTARSLWARIVVAKSHQMFKHPLRYCVYIDNQQCAPSHYFGASFWLTLRLLQSCVPCLPAQVQDSTFTDTNYAISASDNSTVSISNCKVMKGLTFLTLFESSAYIVDSEIVDNFTFLFPVMDILSNSQLILERCAVKHNFSIFVPSVISVVDASKLILKGDENKFIKNRSVIFPSAHIQVGDTSEVSGCKNTTFLAPIKGVVDGSGKPLSC
jgi:hypothetical protein